MNNENIFRIIDSKLMELEKPSIFLNEMKLSKEFNESNFEILYKLSNIEQELKYHPEGSVWNHMCMVVDFASIAKRFTGNERAFMWGALLHDIGKITTTIKRKGRWTSYNHDTVGFEMAKELLNKESIDIEFNEKVCELVKFHMHHIYIIKNLPFGNIEELIKTNNINDILLLFACDKLGRGDQNNEEKNKIFNEVISILNILENKSNKKYKEARNSIINFKDIVISLEK